MGGSRRAVLGLAFLAAFAAAAAAEPPIRAARWIAGADSVRVLSERPAECLARPADPDAVWSVEVGRAVFRSPLLLGGQAARAGLSCESCHRNGRGNPSFAFPGVSGAPGTADVTSALFSSFRDDGAFNPKPIPDLAAPDLKVARSDLAPFLHGLVVEEFNGERPGEAVLEGLTDYVAAIGLAACPAHRTERVDVRSDLADTRRAVRAALGAIERNEAISAGVLIDAARAMLGQIDERYASLEGPRSALRRSSRALQAAGEAVRRGEADAELALTLWLARSAELERQLARAQSRSLYDRRRLRAVF